MYSHYVSTHHALIKGKHRLYIGSAFLPLLCSQKRSNTRELATRYHNTRERLYDGVNTRARLYNGVPLQRMSCCKHLKRMNDYIIGKKFVSCTLQAYLSSNYHTICIASRMRFHAFKTLRHSLSNRSVCRSVIAVLHVVRIYTSSGIVTPRQTMRLAPESKFSFPHWH